ncbi:MAG: hypothetical protein WDZ35_12770 [Crocinitomicaceae bacterium]
MSRTLGIRHNKVKKNKEEVIILANGPSLKTELEDPGFIKKIKQLDTLCVNHFSSSDYFKVIKPNYYVIAAPELWQKETTEAYQQARLKLFHEMASEVDWNMTLMLPFQAKKVRFWQEILRENKNIQLLYYNITALEGFEGITHYLYRKKLGMPRIHNVLGPSIMNMIWLNYQKIYLVGVDHSWIPLISVTEENVALVGQPHFYDKNVKPEIMNKSSAGSRKLHEILHKFYLTFKGYFIIKRFSEKRKVQIINLTKNSYIDSFKREDIRKWKEE